MALTLEQKIMLSGCILTGCALNTIGSLVTLLWVTGSTSFVWTLPNIALVVDAGSGAFVTTAAYRQRNSYKQSAQSTHSIELDDPVTGQRPHNVFGQMNQTIASNNRGETRALLAPIPRRPAQALLIPPNTLNSPYGTMDYGYAAQLTAGYAAPAAFSAPEADTSVDILCREEKITTSLRA